MLGIVIVDCGKNRSCPSGVFGRKPCTRHAMTTPDPTRLFTAAKNRRVAVVLEVKLQQGKGGRKSVLVFLNSYVCGGVGFFSLLGSSKFLGIFCRL